MRTPYTEKLLDRLRAVPLGPQRSLSAEDVRRALHCDLPFFAESHTETVPPVGPARESAQ